MKTREAFEEIRRRKTKFSLRVRLILLVMAELVICTVVGTWLWSLWNGFTKNNSYWLLFVNFVTIGLIIGSILTGLLSKMFFNPIKKLREAMGKVADGDFSVRLDTNVSSNEIQEMYSGFNLMAQELASTEILQTDFVSNVSHEFKTPINAIEGYTMLLQDCENMDENQKQYIEKILFNTRRLSTLVGNILLLSKIENQSIQTNQTKFRLDEQIRQAILALEPSWTEKNIEFDVDLDSIEYVGNANLLHHVWANLIGNAIKFNSDNGFVKLRLLTSGNNIIFTVEDNGPGLSQEAQKHLFDKFYQGDSSHKQDGNGLGLTLVKRILTISGGDISAENLPEGGCRFTVILNNFSETKKEV